MFVWSHNVRNVVREEPGCCSITFHEVARWKPLSRLKAWFQSSVFQYQQDCWCSSRVSFCTWTLAILDILLLKFSHEYWSQSHSQFLDSCHAGFLVISSIGRLPLLFTRSAITFLVTKWYPIILLADRGPYLYLCLRGGQHAVQCWGHSRFWPIVQPQDNQKIIQISSRLLQTSKECMVEVSWYPLSMILK